MLKKTGAYLKRKIDHAILLSYYLTPKRKTACDDDSMDVLVALEASFGGLGDFMLSFDVLRGFGEFYEGKRIVLLVRAEYVAFAESTGIVDEVIGFPTETAVKNHMETEIDFANKLRKRGFHAIINIRFGKHLHSDLLIRVLNSKQKIKINSYTLNYRLSLVERVTESWYTTAINVDRDSNNEMLLIRYAKCLRALGYTGFLANLPRIPYSKEAKKLDISEYVAICPGSSSTKKNWQWEKYALIVQYINSKYNLQCVLIGSQSDSEIYVAEQICNYDGTVKVVNLVGKTSIAETVEVIRGAQLYIGNDTGPSHIAAAVDTKAIWLSHCVRPGEFVPYVVESKELHGFQVPLFHEMDCFNCLYDNANVLSRCLKANNIHPCVSNITVDEVKNAIDNMII